MNSNVYFMTQFNESKSVFGTFVKLENWWKPYFQWCEPEITFKTSIDLIDQTWVFKSVDCMAKRFWTCPFQSTSMHEIHDFTRQTCIIKGLFETVESLLNFFIEPLSIFEFEPWTDIFKVKYLQYSQSIKLTQLVSQKSIMRTSGETST